MGLRWLPTGLKSVMMIMISERGIGFLKELEFGKARGGGLGKEESGIKENGAPCCRGASGTERQ